MTVHDVKEYFGNSNQFAVKTGISHTIWYYWDKVGYVPIASQLRIQRLTNGVLKADLKHTLEGVE